MNSISTALVILRLILNQLIQAKAWNITEKEPVFEKYLDLKLNHFRGTLPLSSGYVIPFADSPLDKEPVGKMVYLDLINRAERYVHIMTPYLVLDHAMMESLCYAAKRGVDVKLILPHIPDKKYVFAMAKTHYPELMRAGVKIYELDRKSTRLNSSHTS